MPMYVRNIRLDGRAKGYTTLVHLLKGNDVVFEQSVINESTIEADILADRVILWITHPESEDLRAIVKGLIRTKTVEFNKGQFLPRKKIL